MVTPAEYNNIHDLFLKERGDFLARGALWVACIGIIAQGVNVVLHLLIVTGVIVIQ